jgi:NAD(P)-dependent dehydrogenase (short-subunit alcohol dehydrogenase family)
MSDFEGKAALVTGAAGGIGRATAERLERGGADVIRVDLDQADVSDAEQVARLFEGIERLDVLITCAGIQRYGTVEETSEALWDEVMNVNLKSAFLCSKAAIPLLRAAGGGAIVIVSSTQAHAAQPGAAAYVTSKGALNALTRAMAVDHAAEGIRVNAVCPASVDTPMLRWAADHLANGRAASELLAEWGSVHPLGRVGAAEEVAELIAFLASSRASFMTGGDYRVDGGLLAQLGVSTRGHE